VTNYEDFYKAADELDAMTLEGFFGDSAKDLVIKREATETNEFLYECLINIFNGDQYGTANVIGITFLLLKLYGEAVTAGGQEAVDILSAFMKGTLEHPELECISSYSEFLRTHMDFKNLSSALREKEIITAAEKKQLASTMLTSYSKGVELVGKAFTQLLTLEQIINNQPYNLFENSLLTIYMKTEKFLKLSDGKYDKLITIIDRSVRNADSHLNAYYSVAENAYIMKKATKMGGKNKIETFKLNPEKMALEVYPKIGWFVQGFISSCILLVLALSDREKFQSATKYILSLKK